MSEVFRIKGIVEIDGAGAIKNLQAFQAAFVKIANDIQAKILTAAATITRNTTQNVNNIQKTVVNDTRTINNNVNYITKNTTTNFTKMAKAGADAANSMKKNFAGLDRTIGSFSSFFTGIQAERLAKTMLNAEMATQRFNLQLSILLRDLTTVQNLTTWVQTYEAKTPFELPELQKATVLFTKLTKIRGEDVGKVKEYIKLAGEMSSLFNKPLEKAAEGLFKTMSGAASGITILRNNFGVSRKELEDLGVKFSRSGKMLPMDEDQIKRIEKALFEMFRRLTDFKLAEGLSQSLEGKLSTLGSQAFTTAKAFGHMMVPAAMQLVDSLQRVLVGLEKMDPATRSLIGGFALFAGTVGTVLVAIGPILFFLNQLVEGYANLNTATMVATGAQISIGARLVALMKLNVGAWALAALRGGLTAFGAQLVFLGNFLKANGLLVSLQALGTVMKTALVGGFAGLINGAKGAGAALITLRGAAMLGLGGVLAFAALANAEIVKMNEETERMNALIASGSANNKVQRDHLGLITKIKDKTAEQVALQGVSLKQIDEAMQKLTADRAVMFTDPTNNISNIARLTKILSELKIERNRLFEEGLGKIEAEDGEDLGGHLIDMLNDFKEARKHRLYSLDSRNEDVENLEATITKIKEMQETFDLAGRPKEGFEKASKDAKNELFNTYNELSKARVDAIKGEMEAITSERQLTYKETIAFINRQRKSITDTANEMGGFTRQMLEDMRSLQKEEVKADNAERKRKQVKAEADKKSFDERRKYTLQTQYEIAKLSMYEHQAQIADLQKDLDEKRKHGVDVLTLAQLLAVRLIDIERETSKKILDIQRDLQKSIQEARMTMLETALSQTEFGYQRGKVSSDELQKARDRVDIEKLAQLEIDKKKEKSELEYKAQKDKYLADHLKEALKAVDMEYKAKKEALLAEKKQKDLQFQEDQIRIKLTQALRRKDTEEATSDWKMEDLKEKQAEEGENTTKETANAIILAIKERFKIEMEILKAKRDAAILAGDAEAAAEANHEYEKSVLSLIRQQTKAIEEQIKIRDKKKSGSFFKEGIMTAEEAEALEKQRSEEFRRKYEKMLDKDRKEKVRTEALNKLEVPSDLRTKVFPLLNQSIKIEPINVNIQLTYPDGRKETQTATGLKNYTPKNNTNQKGKNDLVNTKKKKEF